MPLAFKPHTVTVLPAIEVIESGAVPPPRYNATGEEVDCQVTPLSAAAAFSKTGVMLRRPYEILCDVPDAGKFHIGDRVVWEEETYLVIEPPRVWKAGDVTDSANLVIALGQFIQA